MKRRDFLKSSLPAAAAIHGGLRGESLPAAVADTSTQKQTAYDLVVVGGTLSGCFAARHAASLGMKVLLVERRTFLGTEITASLRPWLQRDGFTEWSRELKSLFLPQEEQDEVGVPFDLDNVSTVFGNEIPLFAGTTKNS